jgi:small conductance mechanosensitive channel
VIDVLALPAPVSDFGRWFRGSGLEIIMLGAGAVLLARFVKWFSAVIADRAEAQRAATKSLVRSEDDKHRRALSQVVTWVLVVMIYVIAGILIIEKFGIALAAFVPVATVAGVALGFGAQKIVADLVAGFFMVAERQYGFGDLVRVSVVGLGVPVLGTVENVSLRTTTVRTATGEVVITPNGQIAQITNLSRDWARAVIDVPVSVALDVNHVLAVLRKAGEAAYADESLHDLLLDTPSVMGVESLEVDQFQVRMVARTLPGKQFEVGRARRVLITRTLREEGIHLQAEISTGEPTGTA